MDLASGNLTIIAIEYGPFIVELPIKDGDFPQRTVGYQMLHGEKPRGCTMDTMMYMDVYHVFVQEYGC